MLKKQNKSQLKGFTIIEVVLVLAIAGLIFLMVFIALPAMQRSQRDTQRRNDYSMLSTAVTSFSSSNQGKLYRLTGASSGVTGNNCNPLDATTYVNDEGQDPNGKDYIVTACTWTGWVGKGFSDVNADKPSEAEAYVIIGANCDGYDPDGYSIPKEDPSSRAFAIFAYVEGGSQTYCTASQ